MSRCGARLIVSAACKKKYLTNFAGGVTAAFTMPAERERESSHFKALLNNPPRQSRVFVWVCWIMKGGSAKK
jgi:hypothetical protein